MVCTSGEVFGLGLSTELTTQVISLCVGMSDVSLNGTIFQAMHVYFTKNSSGGFFNFCKINMHGLENCTV